MPIFMLINDIFCVCILLTCHLCFITAMFMRERSSKNVIPGPVLAIRKLLVIFMLFYMVLLNLKITKTLVTHFVLFSFINLRAVGS
jgi:hypothetical protein